MGGLVYLVMFLFLKIQFYIRLVDWGQCRGTHTPQHTCTHTHTLAVIRSLYCLLCRLPTWLRGHCLQSLWTIFMVSGWGESRSRGGHGFSLVKNHRLLKIHGLNGLFFWGNKYREIFQHTAELKPLTSSISSSGCAFSAGVRWLWA